MSKDVVRSELKCQRLEAKAERLQDENYNLRLGLVAVVVLFVCFVLIQGGLFHV